MSNFLISFIITTVSLINLCQAGTAPEDHVEDDDMIEVGEVVPASPLLDDWVIIN